MVSRATGPNEVDGVLDEDAWRTAVVVPLPFERRVFSQYLFSYKLNPQTVLFAGYSDNAAAITRTDLQRTDRTSFVKLGYAWVL